MSLRNHLPVLAASTILLLLSTGLPAGEALERDAVSVAGQKEVRSAGLLNDALRLTSPEFDPWNIGGQFRIRYERRDDAGSFPNRDFVRNGVNNSNDYLLFREKLHAGWQPQGWLHFYVEVRGSHVAGDEREPSSDRDIFDLQQAYVVLGDQKDLLSLKAGRQEMLYGEQRFVGISDWSNTGRAFDAAVLRYAVRENTWIDVFTGRVVIPVDGTFNESNDYDQFTGIYASTQSLWPGVETQAFFFSRNVDSGSPNAISTGVGGPSERNVYTYGAHWKSLPGRFLGWDFAIEGAGQFGEVVSSGTTRVLDSFSLTGSLGYTFDELSMKPRFGVGYDYASGDSNAADGRQETFEQLFSVNHGFYGAADLVGLRNLNSPRVSFSIKPVKGMSVSADYLLFWLANTADSFYPESAAGRTGNGYGKNPQFDSFVGAEFDLVAKYAVTSWLEMQFGYAHFYAGDYIKQSAGSIRTNGGATDADWAYAQLAFSF